MSSKSPQNDTDTEPDEKQCDGVRMTISVEDSAAARELLRCLGETSAAVSFSVDCISASGTHPCAVTVDHLSEKQIEVVRMAVERGYYDTPRQASLSDLAAELDVSPSAVSQRLNGVEHKLVKALAQSCG